MAKRPTMDDVAREAEVSQATVSMVLNDAQAGRVSDETAQRVRDAAARLGYRTNMHAKVLREGKAQIIGLIGDEVATSPFAGAMILGAQQQAWKRGYVLLTVDTAGSANLEGAAIEMLQSYRVAGVLYAAMYHRILEVPRSLRTVRTVCLNAQDADGRVPSVFPDEERGGREATEHLLAAGHRRIGIINIQAGDESLPAATGRLVGYRAALEAAGLPVDPDLIRHGHGTYEDGLNQLPGLMELDDPPTAIFCANDRTALGAYHALAARGLSVPGDVSIVGFDDQTILEQMFSPRLTTVQLPLAQMGRLAVDTLLDATKGSDRLPVTCSLISRQSVSPAKVLL